MDWRADNGLVGSLKTDGGCRIAAIYKYIHKYINEWLPSKSLSEKT